MSAPNAALHCMFHGAQPVGDGRCGQLVNHGNYHLCRMPLVSAARAAEQRALLRARLARIDAIGARFR